MAAQPPGDAAANLAAGGKLDAALALLDTWLADHPDDPRMFPVLLQVVTAAPRQPTVDAVVARYRSRLANDQVAVLRAAPADFAELSGGVEQALQALELPGVPAAPERRAALLLELGQVTLDTVPEGMPIVHAGLVRFGEVGGAAVLEPSLRAAFDGTEAQADGGATGAVAGYGLVSLLAANGRAAEAARVLEQMRSRYPRSPEYALAAAVLNAGAGLPRVVAFPSPAMLLGSLVANCRPLCPAPAAVLLARATERPEMQAPPAAVAAPELPAAVVVVPEAEPVAVVVAPEAEPAAVVVAPEAEPAAVVVAPEVEPAAVVVAPEAEPAAVVAVPEIEPVAVVLVVSAAEPAAVAVVAAPEVERPATVVVASEPVRVAAAPASSPAAGKSVPAPASRAATDLPVRVSTRPARPSTATAGSAADQISRRVSAVLASTGAASPPTSPPTPTLAGTSKGGDPVVRVAARPDPAAFIVQIGAYHDPDNALELEHQLIAAGFPALARSYRVAGGGIVHRVAVSRNVTRTKAGQLLAGLRNAGYDGFITRRDDVSYLPPPPPTR